MFLLPFHNATFQKIDTRETFSKKIILNIFFKKTLKDHFKERFVKTHPEAIFLVMSDPSMNEL